MKINLGLKIVSLAPLILDTDFGDSGFISIFALQHSFFHFNNAIPSENFPHSPRGQRLHPAGALPYMR
jgi:hypothetical protein